MAAASVPTRDGRASDVETLTEDPLPEDERLSTVYFQTTEPTLAVEEPRTVNDRVEGGPGRSTQIGRKGGGSRERREKETGPVGGTRSVAEGWASVGRCRLTRLRPPSGEGDPPGPALYSIDVPITFHWFPGERQYAFVTVRFHLDEAATALSLFPDSVTEEQVERTYGLTPGLRFLDLAELKGECLRAVKFTRLRPMITSYGEGESRFYWVYSDATGAGILPGTRHHLIILEIPAGQGSLQGRIEFEARLRKHVLGAWKEKATDPAAVAFSWNLPAA